MNETPQAQDTDERRWTAHRVLSLALETGVRAALFGYPRAFSTLIRKAGC